MTLHQFSLETIVVQGLITAIWGFLLSKGYKPIAREGSNWLTRQTLEWRKPSSDLAEIQLSLNLYPNSNNQVLMITQESSMSIASDIEDCPLGGMTNHTKAPSRLITPSLNLPLFTLSGCPLTLHNEIYLQALISQINVVCDYNPSLTHFFIEKALEQKLNEVCKELERFPHPTDPQRYSLLIKTMTSQSSPMTNVF